MPNAKVILESTPGRAGSHHEQMWRSALEGTSRFTPLFLEWWEDDSCREMAEDFEPTVTELEYMRRHSGMSKYNLAFRRRGLNTEFVGDSRLFSCKYPSDPYDGWLGTTNPVLPAEVLKPWLAKAKADELAKQAQEQARKLKAKQAVESNDWTTKNLKQNKQIVNSAKTSKEERAARREARKAKMRGGGGGGKKSPSRREKKRRKEGGKAGRR